MPIVSTRELDVPCPKCGGTVIEEISVPDIKTTRHCVSEGCGFYEQFGAEYYRAIFDTIGKFLK
ncbi:hypothetical protein AAEH95_20590 [Shewanella xiamenensis]|uniref:hypothetical protein n=1 Tax=Shewanella xiamenensis TaxID=332186 RepID=UPI0021BEF6B9|nr:hypothetical protein [Shewanella xiamenensis]MCT8869484.1 hypothetical protein [Shewanella xiamenensis]